MESKQRWQDWVILALALWLLLAPFFMPFGSLHGAAAWNSYVVGAIAALFAAWALGSPESKDAEWALLVVGLWLIAAPFALGFYATESTAAWNHVVVGLLIAGDAIWAMIERPASGTPVHHH